MKYSNLDEQMSEGFEALRNQPTPAEATDSALRAVVANPAPSRASAIGLKLAGVGGTIAVLALAFWPRTGSGIAWAQVVSELGNAPRIHETMAFKGKDGKWINLVERWTDGKRYAMKYGGSPQFIFEARFDGERAYSARGPLGYSSIQTVPPSERAATARISFLGSGVQLIEEYIKDEKGKVEGQEKITDEKLGEVVRYKIRNSILRKGKWIYGHQLVYVEPDTRRIRKWELLDAQGVPEQRGFIEYPESIDDSVFTIPSEPLQPFYDVDVQRKQVAEFIKKGIGVAQVGSAKTTIRAALTESRHYLWVFWSGAPPNGDLKYPVMVEGYSTKRIFGQPILTSSRVNVKGTYRSLLGGPLSGMCLQLSKDLPETINLKVPVYVQDKTKPIRDASTHKVLGYRSRFVGYDTVKNIHPLAVPSPYVFGDQLGFVRTNVDKGYVMVASGVGTPISKKKK